MEDNIEEARANICGLLRRLFFQEASRDYIFSMIKRKSLRLTRPFSIGNPKYLSRKVVLLVLS